MKLPKIKKLPSGNYHCEVKINGKRISITEPTKNECHNRAVLLKSGITKNTTNTTLRNAIDRYIEARSNVLSPATIRGYRTIQRNRFKGVIDMRIDAVTNWQAVVNSETHICGAKTLKNAWGFVSSVLKENGVSVSGITLPQIITTEHAFLQPDEIKPFIAAIKGDKYELVYLLALHGMRHSEIMALDIKNSISNGKIKIRGAAVPNEHHKYIWKAENKNTSSRRDIPVLIPRVTELVGTSTADLQSVIQSTSYGVYKHLMQICKDNNIEYMGLHGLRHSFASLCYKLQISEAETMRLGGWSDPGVMRRIYTHLSEMENKESEEKLRSFFQLENIM